MKTDYIICQKPSYISFICPACGATNDVDWEDVSANDEYDKWHGGIDPISCEECDSLIYFGGCEID